MSKGNFLIKYDWRPQNIIMQYNRNSGLHDGEISWQGRDRRRRTRA